MSYVLPDDDNELLTADDLSKAFKVDPKTATRWDKTGKLKAAVRTPGGHRRWRTGDVRPFIENQGD